MERGCEVEIQNSRPVNPVLEAHRDLRVKHLLRPDARVDVVCQDVYRRLILVRNCFQITSFAPLIETRPYVAYGATANIVNLENRDFFRQTRIKNNVEPSGLVALQFAQK